MDNYSASFGDLQDYSSLQPHHHHQQQQHQQGYELMKPPLPLRPMMIMGEPHEDNDNVTNNNANSVEHFLLHNHNHTNNQLSTSPSGFDKLMSFADVMQFADFGPKLALNQHYDDDKGAALADGMEDPVYFLKFPVLNDRISNNNNHIEEVDERRQLMMNMSSSSSAPQMLRFDEYVEGAANGLGEEAHTTAITTTNNAAAATSSEVQLQFGGAINDQQAAGSSSLPEGATVPAVPASKNNNSNKRKRAPRSVKTTEEVESQRMTHIAVERNRRKQMNEHLRVLRSLMPGSYVQRGDQASIIGGAIEFVRELEQLLQCLESQKRRRLYGEANPQTQRQNNIGVVVGDDNKSSIHQQQQQQPSSVFFPAAGLLQNGDHEDDEAAALVNLEASGLVVREEMAENKSCLADVEVKVLGLDAMIKVLSRRRPGQLIKAIAALEDLQLNILHTNITTIEQTVLYSFNVKVESEGRFTAEEIASSVQQIFTFIHANSGGSAHALVP